MAYDDEFDGPGAAGDFINWQDLKGRLLLITPYSEEEQETVHGKSKCVRADVIVLDAEPAEQKEWRDCLIFPKVLCSQVKANIKSGRRNLGRLGQGAAQPGKTAAWVLEDPTDADRVLAREWLKTGASAPF